MMSTTFSDDHDNQYITMKKSLFTLMLGWFGLLLCAQPPGPPPGPRDAKMEKKVEAMRIAFITNELDLTPEESQVFWPLFNEMREKERALREEMRPSKPLEELSDKEAQIQLENQMKLADEEAALHKAYTERFLKILPAAKVLKLQQAEGEFRRRLINEVKERRMRKDRPGRR